MLERLKKEMENLEEVVLTNCKELTEEEVKLVVSAVNENTCDFLVKNVNVTRENGVFVVYTTLDNETFSTWKC